MRQPHSYPTEAIVLGRTDIGEADRILTLFTPHKGKFRAVAKGIRRTTSRKAGHLEYLSHSQLQLALGRNLDIITQAEHRDSFLHLRDDLWHMTCGLYLAELVDSFIEEHTPQPAVYALMLRALHNLETDGSDMQQQDVPPIAGQERTRSQLILRHFEIHLLAHTGYEPAFRQCAHCGNELQPAENGFAPALGGALCPQCSSMWTRAISINALKVLRLLQRSEPRDVPRLRLEASLVSETEQVMRGLLRYHLERDLKSWVFLDLLAQRDL